MMVEVYPLVVPQSLYDRMVEQGFSTDNVIVAQKLPVGEDDECDCRMCAARSPNLPDDDARTGASMSKIMQLIRDYIPQDVHPPAVIEPEDTLDAVGYDSLSKIELLMALEEEYGIEIPDAEAEDIVTVGDVIQAVEKHA